MMAFLWGILGPFRKALAWAAAAAAILGAAFLAGRRDAKQGRKVDDLKAVNKAHEVRNEVDNRIAVERDAKRRLHDEWSE
jgi:hypothetical protein